MKTRAVLKTKIKILTVLFEVKICFDENLSRLYWSCMLKIKAVYMKQELVIFI